MTTTPRKLNRAAAYLRRAANNNHPCFTATAVAFMSDVWPQEKSVAVAVEAATYGSSVSGSDLVTLGLTYDRK